MSGIFKRFKRSENGSATVEFVILFPIFIFIFLMGFESGYYMVRNVMLERAVDITSRDIKLGNGNIPQFQHLKANICAQAGIIPDCMNSLQVELQRIDAVPGATAALRGNAKCNDKNATTQDNQNATFYDVGSANNVLMLRVCALSEPLFPTTGIGVGMKVQGKDDYAIVATTVLVAEPGTRSINELPTWMNPPAVSN